MSKLKILMLHCRYTQPGGEDVSVQVEAQILRDAGHDVRFLEFQNSELTHLTAANRQAFSWWAYTRVHDEVEAYAPNIAWFHNTSWSLGPSAVMAASHCGVPTVAAIHNARLMFRWRDIIHSPYRGSRAISVPIAAGNLLHRTLTWKRHVDVFVPVSEALRARLKADGFDRHGAQIVVKPNGLAVDPPVGRGDGGYALFVGRLVPEKGVQVLADAWLAANTGIPLKMLGSGPLQGYLETLDRHNHCFEYLGQQSHEETLRIMGGARFLVVPSTWQEPFGRVAIEAMATGTPTIVSNVGGLPETRPLMLVPPGDVATLTRAIRTMMALSPAEYAAARGGARRRYEESFSPQCQLDQLMDIYNLAGERRDARRKRNLRRLRDPATDEYLRMLDRADPPSRLRGDLLLRELIRR